ncbi:MAG: hypothetical protein MJZ84_02405 [Paludibacteraceae bacterium]|nr:hypothetical protein [Paludibacteraceae bacterium]
MKKRFLLLFMIACSCFMWGQSITIETLDDLIDLFTNNVAQNGYAGQTIELNNDLTITKPWRPIGTAAQPFQGTFKGNGHVISGLGAISGTDGVGLFGYVGANGTIQELGIGTGHIKTMKNDVCQNIGSLAGHNAGKIVRCWNMATIEANGTNVGGLVGQNAGTIEDCYNAGPILKATDIIGGLVGMNTGKINRCYNIGFARNGYGLVEKSTGTITEGYYDSQLYVQIPEPFEHFDPEGVTAVEKTETMFSLFASSEQWTNSNDNYPMLTVFKDHDAAKVSVASADVDPLDGSLVENHMNVLIGFFKVNTANGVSWNTTSTEQANWVFPISGNEWGISHPCRPTECILTVSKGNHVREVYAAPLPVNPFDPGVLLADTQTICVDDTLYFQHVEYVTYGDPGGGVLDYKMLLIATQFNFDGDSIKNDTILDAGFGEYYDLFWHGGHWIPTEPGIYKIRRYAADSQCHLDYAEAYGCIPVIAPDTVNPGDINASESDSLCYADSVITITNKELAVCPGTKLLYYWTVNGDSIEGAHAADLEYTLPQPGTYSFLRYAYNDKCTSKEEAKVAPTEYNVILLDEFKEGEINSTDTFRICNPEDVISSVGTITATAATGGDNKIGYQWYMIAGETATAISGATSQDLTLSDVADQLSFEFDKTYSIFRMVNDSMCQTEPISSKDTVVIIVYPEFKVGNIPVADDSICSEGNHKVTINSVTDATFGSLDVYYFWTVQFANGNEDSIRGENNASLIDYADFSASGTYTFRRYAYNTLCVDRDYAKVALEEYKVTLLEEFNPGSIVSDSIVVCTVEEALALISTIQGNPATGGDGTYLYKWNMREEGTTDMIPDSIANEKDLDLTKVTLRQGFKYTFYREAKDDYCQTEWQQSDNTYVIEIFGAVTAGEIENKTIDSTCMIASQTEQFDVVIGSVKDATTPKGDIVYTWYMTINGGTPVIVGNDTTLTYTIETKDITGLTTYTFYRTAMNRNCDSEEVRDAGQTTVQVSLTGTIDKEIILCESQFVNGKYDYYYPVDNPYRKVTFDLNDPKPISFSDLMASTTCPPYVTLTPVIIPSPAISTESEAEICQDGEDGTITLYFLMEKGSADMYSIELSEGLRPYFNNQAYITGDLNEVVHEGERGAITLQCSRIGLLGDKIMYLQVGTKSEQSGQETCFSAPKEIRLQIAQGGYIMSKYDKVLFIDNNPKKDTDHKFIDYQWYKNGAPVEGAKGQYYSEGGEILHGSYFADLTYLENGQPVVLRTCTMEMPIENSRRTAVPTENISKQLENGRIVIQRGDAKFDVLGNKISSL